MNRVNIREYTENDIYEIGILISDTYRKYNLSHVPEIEMEAYLNGFFHCRSKKDEHRKKIASLICAPMVFVAQAGDRVAGVLRGSPGRLHSLFVHEDFHRQGIGRRLMAHFESICKNTDVTKITLAASLYAVPFYLAVGYKKSTGVRKSRSFDGTDFYIQPMKKIL